MYWAHSRGQNGLYDRLRAARMVFETRPGQGSEPDLIVETPDAIIVIEAKLGSGNLVRCQEAARVSARYQENGWWRQVFREDYQRVACKERRYEIARLWLLGSWMAKEAGKAFRLVVLMPRAQDADLERQVRPLLLGDDRFARSDWESVYEFVAGAPGATDRRTTFLEYFRNKTLGYDSSGRLQKAFTVR
jgi:hypothetical protein